MMSFQPLMYFLNHSPPCRLSPAVMSVGLLFHEVSSEKCSKKKGKGEKGKADKKLRKPQDAGQV